MTDPNGLLLEAAVRLLRPLLSELVFLGGSATGLLITDQAEPAVRATDDVDVITRSAHMRSTQHSLSVSARLG
jgi:hypothetical protein